MNFEKIALHVPTILLPRKETDISRWAVVACDQYTAQPQYWSDLKEQVGDCPSTLNMIFPEAFLESGDQEQRIAAINAAMQQALDQGLLIEQPPGFVLVDRQLSGGQSRKGLVAALDLEHYDYSDGSRSLIRATEGTILDRLPPRVRVRQKAPLELPHIMVLIDDPEQTVIEPLFDKSSEPAYEADLMMGGGHIRGFRVNDPGALSQVATALSRLADPETFRRKYDEPGPDVLLYAMGDGNHSFATAKVIWEEIKQAAGGRGKIMQHPARYALVELVNVHDPGLEFEPIHRVVFGVSGIQTLQQHMAPFLTQSGSELTVQTFPSRESLIQSRTPAGEPGLHQIAFVSGGTFGQLMIKNPALSLEVATLQAALDAALESLPGAKIDYIHGQEVVTELGADPNSIGFYLPVLSKHSLFKTIIRDGALPRKAFSMGEAHDKRFYLECRSIADRSPID